MARAWEKYDIRLILHRNWPQLGPRLQGKLRIYMGTLDTFRLEGAAYLLRDELERLGSDAQFVFAQGRDHGTLARPHPDLWPDGMLVRIHREMAARWQAGQKK